MPAHDDLERLRRHALSGDLDAAQRLLHHASRRGDRQLAVELRRAVPQLRWPGCTFLRVNPSGAREFVHDRSGLVLVEIPGGPFWLADEHDARAQAAPRPYALDTYLIGRLPVPQAVFWRFTEAHRDRRVPVLSARHTLGWHTRRPQTAALCSPVHSVAWSQARAFCSWAGLALPSLHQWLKAARGADDARPYAWGDTPPSSEQRALEAELVSRPLWCTEPHALDDARAAPFASPYGALSMGWGQWEWVDDSDTVVPEDGDEARRAACGAGAAGEVGRAALRLPDHGASYITFRVALDAADADPLELDEVATAETRAFMLRVESELAGLRARLRPPALGLDAIAPLRADARERLATRDALLESCACATDWRTRLQIGGVELGFDPDDVPPGLTLEGHAALLDDLEHLDPLALMWHAPRNERGRVTLRNELLLACYAPPGHRRATEVLALLARHGDTQVLTLRLEPTTPAHHAERWERERYRWDRRAAATPLAERWGVAGLALARLGPEARESELERLGEYPETRAERAARCILLQDSGRLEDALALYPLALDDEVVALLRGEPVTGHPPALREPWTRHLQLAMQRLAPWRLEALVRDPELSRASLLTALPHQDGARRIALMLGRNADGQPHLSLATTGSERCVARNRWLRAREIDLLRFGLIDAPYPEPSR